MNNDELNQLERVAEFYSSVDANLAKGVLENNNIFATIEGEHSADLSLTISGIGNHVYLQVLHKDLGKAIELIKGMEVDYTLLIENA